MRRMYSEEQLERVAQEQAKNVIEGGQVSNAKPIYCHPLTIQRVESGVKLRITCLIFNNDATPFTLATFKDWIDNLYNEVGDTIRIMISGAYYDTTKLIIASHLSKDSSGYFVQGMTVSDNSPAYVGGQWSTLFDNDTLIADGVNKIN